MDENEVIAMFSSFGILKSFSLKQNKHGKYGFVCYEGNKVTQNPIKGLNGRIMSNGEALHVSLASKNEKE